MAAAAVASTREHLQRADPDGWVVRDGGAIARVTGVRAPKLNGVLSERVSPDPDVVAALLDRVAATGLPYSLVLRPGADPALAKLAVARGLSESGEYPPLMVLQDPARLGPAQRVAGLAIRQLDPEEAGVHAAVAAAGYEAPEEMFRRLGAPAVLGLPGVRCYVGEAGGRLVTTGIGVTMGPFVGVINITTTRPDRGRGYGAAITARVVSDGLSAGASWAWLQSSPDGYRVYERLGFRIAESWQAWLSET